MCRTEEYSYLDLLEIYVYISAQLKCIITGNLRKRLSKTEFGHRLIKAQ